MCDEDKLTLREEEMDIPYFGKVFLFSMDCAACGYRKADVEPAEAKKPCKYTFDVSSVEDLNVKVVKSGDATVKIPHIITIEPGPTSEGYVTNIEGLLERVKKIIESSLEGEDEEGGEEDGDGDTKKKGRNMIKKLNRVMAGQDTLKIIIEDATGHSAIISDKAQKSKL